MGICIKMFITNMYVYNNWMLRENRCSTTENYYFNPFNINMIKYLWKLFKYFMLGERNRIWSFKIHYEHNLFKMYASDEHQRVLHYNGKSNKILSNILSFFFHFFTVWEVIHSFTLVKCFWAPERARNCAKRSDQHNK